MSKKRYAARLCLLLAGCALALVVFEGLVRVIDPHARDFVIPGSLFVMDGNLGWRLKPGMTATHRSRYFAATYTTNAGGYRDRPRTSGQGRQQIRLLFFGDSQVFGWGVAEMLRFTNLVEAKHATLEVWNAGVPGYGLDQQLLAYEHDARDWPANAVAFYVSRATLARTKSGKEFQKYKPRFVLDASGALQVIPPPRSELSWTAWVYRALSPLYAPYFLERRIAMLFEHWGRRADPGSPTTAATHQAPDELSRALLERAAGVARTRGHQLILLLDRLPASWREPLLNFAAQRRIQAVVVESPDRLDDFIHGRDDRHWNPQGHRWIADQFWQQWKGRP